MKIITVGIALARTFQRTWGSMSAEAAVESKIPTQMGMTNEWLNGEGWINIRALWMKAHGYAC